MTWVRNIDGRHYRYRSKRVNGRVKSIYEGKTSGADFSDYKDKFKRDETYNDRRSVQARHIDLATKAEIILEPTKNNIALWKRHKDLFDLRGYDLPTIKKHTSGLAREIIRVKSKKQHIKIEGSHMSGIEQEALYKLADKYSVERDLVDWSALIDRKLSYDENKTQLEAYISKMGIKSEDQLIEQYKFYRQELTEREKEHLKEHTVTIKEYPQYRDNVLTLLKAQQPRDFYDLFDNVAILEPELQGTLEQMERDADIIRNQRGDYLLL